MTAPASLSSERIAAYVDGELSGAEAQAVERALASDPDLRARVDAHRALRARLGAHFAPILTEPVPDHLTVLLRPDASVGAQVIAFPGKASAPPRSALPTGWMRLGGFAIAAAVVVAVVGVALRPDGRYVGSEVAQALDTQLAATQPVDAKVRVLLSFRDGRGAYCRGYSAGRQTGIACHDGGGWRLDKLFTGGATSNQEFRQAGGGDAEAMRAMQDMALAGALDADAERDAMRKRWRN